MNSKMTVTEGALIKRINRKLAKDGERLRRSRSARMFSSVGDVYRLNVNRNFVVDHHVDVETLARDLGCMHENERVERT